MTDALLTPPQSIFPIGTTVGAYARTQWPVGRPETAAPDGAALESHAVASDGTLTFTTLAAGYYYAAADMGGGAWRRLGFRVGSALDVPGSALDPSLFPDSSIPGAKLQDDAVTAAKIAAGAVGTSELADGVVAAVDLAADAATQAELDAVSALKLAKASNLSDLANAGTARTNLGLGSSATKDSGAAGAAGKVLAADDASTSDARTPTAHHTTHSKAGSDAVALGDIATAIGDVPSALIDAIMPWRVEINPHLIRDDSSGTWASATNTGDLFNARRANSSVANGDYEAWDVALAAGTWVVYVMAVRFSAQGIVTASINAVDGANMDFNGATLANFVQNSGAIVVPVTGKWRVKLRLNGKTGSAFGLGYNWVTLRRTA